MNCLVLLALLFCCGGEGFNNRCNVWNCCGNGGNNGNRRGCDNRREREENNCRRNDNNGCGCRQDGCPEPRLEPRPFISYQGSSSCGCEAQENNSCN